MKIGLQLFTARKQAQKDLYGTLRTLSTLGIKYLEAARISFDDASIEAFTKAKEDFGTEVVACQIKPDVLENDFDNCVKFMKSTNCNLAVVSVLPLEYILGNGEKLLNYCKWLSNLAAKYKAVGIQLCHHHHDFEFIRCDKNGTKFDILVENVSKDVNFIIDTYWATKAGINLEKLLKRLPNRISGLHLRDFGLRRKFASIKGTDFALGDGVIDFKSVIETAKETGVVYGAIEQNTKQPFSEISKSVKHLTNIGYESLLK